MSNTSPRGDDDPILSPWLFGIINGLPKPPGDFLKGLARTALRADSSNYAILRPALLQLFAKYPSYLDPEVRHARPKSLGICFWCGEEVLPDEAAPVISEDSLANFCHSECLIRQVAGSVGHQMRTCPCFGGTTEDPIGITRRDAARLACRLARMRKT